MSIHLTALLPIFQLEKYSRGQELRTIDCTLTYIGGGVCRCTLYYTRVLPFFTGGCRYWAQLLGEVASYYNKTKLTFALADKTTMAYEAAQFGHSKLDPMAVDEV